MTIILRFFPNGEFTHGVDTSARKRRHERRHEPTQPLCREHRDRYLQWIETQRLANNADIDLCVPGYQFVGKTGAIFTYLCKDTQGYHYAVEGDGYVLEDVVLKSPPGRNFVEGDFSPLGSSNARILKNPCESRKKCLAMTKSMSRNIRNAAYILEEECKKDNLSFLTLTLPSVSQESLGKICHEWDTIVHRFFMWLKSALNKKNIEPLFVYCTEIQTKRLELRHEYAPHLHIIFRGRNGKKRNWAITPTMARREWVRCIKPCIDEPFDQSALENLQRVKHSAGRYLSKYMSKGSNSLPSMDASDTGITRLVTHWGGMSRKLSRAIRSQTRVLRGDGQNRTNAWAFVDAIPELLERGCIRYYKAGFIVLNGSEDHNEQRGLHVGTGCLSKTLARGGLDASLDVANRLYAGGML